tara:strand:- start:9133 stop:9621 length:489 start_codon:yes stop_codon:yes gene_type:complete
LLIGVTGDTHNNLKNISKICSIFNELLPSKVIHTGDITLPKSLAAFSELKMPLVGVFGNNDIQERKGLLLESNKFDCKLYDEPYSLEVEDLNICILHHPDLIDDEMTKSNDFIFHGHTHRYRFDKENKSLIFNPGECAGLMKGKNSIGLVNTKTKIIEVINF